MTAPASDSLHCKTAIVTGSTRGIGFGSSFITGQHIAIDGGTSITDGS